MISNIGFVGNSYKWFVGQVPPGQNQHVKNSSWDDAHGDRVKVRIPGQHPKTAEVTDDNLPWAIVAKPTSSGNINRTSSGVWGGEWVIGFYLDEGCQIPVITQVLGRGAIDSKLVNSINGTTNFENVSSYNGGLQAGNHQLTGGSSKRSDPRTLPVGSDIKNDAKTDPTSQTVTESGVPKEPTITVNEDGSKTVTVIDADGNKTNYQFKAGEEISPGTLKNLNKIQETNFNLQMSKEATLRGDDAAATYFSNKAAGRDTPLSAYRQQPSFEQQVAQYRPDYTAKDKAEDKLLLRAIQRGELGPVPREQIDAIINRINGVGVRGV